MKAIIIEEIRFVEILELLEAECQIYMKEPYSQGEKDSARRTHRLIHNRLVRWMQDQGASCIR
jgi:hypothetical protein